MQPKAAHFLIFAVVCLSAPWFFAYLHTRVNRRVPPILLYFRYFMSANIFNIGIFSIILMSSVGPRIVEISSWGVSPIIYYYMAVIIALVVTSACTLFGRRTLILAAPGMWCLFLLINASIHATQMGREIEPYSPTLVIWIADKLLVALIMLGFMISLKQRLTPTGIIQHGRE